MDQGSLVEMHIKDGSWIIQELSQHGFDVTVAFWLKTTEDEPWFLYIGSKDVDQKGIAAGYRIVRRTFTQKAGLWLNPFDVKLISPSEPIAKDALRARGTVPNIPTRFAGSRLGSLCNGSA